MFTLQVDRTHIVVEQITGVDRRTVKQWLVKHPPRTNRRVAVAIAEALVQVGAFVPEYMRQYLSADDGTAVEGGAS